MTVKHDDSGQSFSPSNRPQGRLIAQETGCKIADGGMADEVEVRPAVEGVQSRRNLFAAFQSRI